jgi:ketosteroid isomerase-like protein
MSKAMKFPGHEATKAHSLWKGRVCKIYTKTAAGEWKFIFQTGALDYSSVSRGSFQRSR